MNNKGIVISGCGQFSATQVAVGDQPRITNDNWGEKNKLLCKLDDLFSVIQVADIKSSEREEVLKHIKLVKEQAKAANPDKTVMEKSLSMIEKVVPAITGIVSVLAAVKSLAGL
jgi:hypothetical protein